jgi:hypothetical protein
MKKTKTKPEPEVISAGVVSQIVALRAKRDGLAGQLAELAETLKVAEAAVIAQLERNVPLGVGCLPCAVKVTERRSVSWRKEFETRLGKAEAEHLIADTTPSITKSLVIGNGKEGK